VQTTSQSQVVDGGALRDRHLRLRDRARALDLDRRAAEEVQDPDAALEALPADADELGRRPLEPGRHHAAVLVPDGAEALPVAGVAPDGPVLDQLADALPVVGHVRIVARAGMRRRPFYDLGSTHPQVPRERPRMRPPSGIGAARDLHRSADPEPAGKHR
jgi:hypothetical protein